MTECRKSSRSVQWPLQLIAAALAAVIVMLPVPCMSAGEDAAVDPRKIYSSEAPTWLRAIGKLQVPGSTYANGKRTHLLEDCSATLVARHKANEADTIITAWHCLAHYNDLSKPIVFALVSGQRQVIERQAYRLADGGGMYADWAILRLKIPVKAADVAALLIHPDRASPAITINMAGYSRDAVLGDYGNQLTYHPNCAITGSGPTRDDSNCFAYKGSSGGAVVQISGAGTPWFSGVISDGDSAGLSRFVPVAAFRSAINLHLR